MSFDSIQNYLLRYKNEDWEIVRRGRRGNVFILRKSTARIHDQAALDEQFLGIARQFGEKEASAILLVDLSGISHIDTQGLEILMRAKQEVHAHANQMVLTGIAPDIKLQEPVNRSILEAQFDIFTGIYDALKNLPREARGLRPPRDR